MTIQYAIKNGTTRIRLPEWDPGVRVEFELLPNGEVFHFAKMYSGSKDKEGKPIFIAVQSCNFINDPYDGWEVATE